MPLVEHKLGREFNQFERAVEEPTQPTPGDTFGAAWHLENDVANIVDLLSRPAFLPQDGFTVGPALRDYDVKNRTNMFEQYRDRFIGVQSEDEMTYVIKRINDQNVQRDTLERAGWLGVVAGVGAGLVSPTVFLPFVGGGRGLSAVVRGAAIGGVSAVPTELALAANQETRTGGEVALALAASTALGGILGGTIAALRPGERALYEAELERVARPQGVGAAPNEQFVNAGGLASGAQTLARANDKTVLLTNPVTQSINQEEFESFRVLVQQLSDSGLRMARNEEGIPAAVGGTIENRLHYYTGLLVRGDDAFAEAYRTYFFDGTVPSFAPNLRANLAGTFNANGKLSASQFSDEVTRAIWNGFQHDVPEVAKAAQAVAKNVYEPILKAAQEAKLLPEDVQVVGDAAYVNREYNRQAIRANTDEFVRILATNYEKDLNQRFADELEGFKGKQQNRRELAEDLARPESEVDELLEKFREELKGVEEGLPEEIQMLEEAVATNRATARAMRLNGTLSPGEEATYKRLLKDARDMEKTAGEPYEKVKGERARLRRRIGNLNKAVVAVDARRAAKLDRIDRTEELSLTTLSRLVSKAQTTLRQLDKWGDKKLDAEVAKLKDQFARAGEVYDRGEERLVKLAENDEDVHRLGALEDVQQGRAERLDAVAERLENAENLDRTAIRATINEGLNKTLEKVQSINARRVLRNQRLREQAAKLDPEVARARLAEANAAPQRAENDFVNRWVRDFRADDVNPETGIANFKETSRAAAEQVKDKIMGTYLRLPYMEVMAEKRGSELRRVLHISSKEIDKFLDKDIRRLTRVYTRTLGPDIELMNKFGTINGSEILQPAIDELNAKIKAVGETAPPEGADPRGFEARQSTRQLKLNNAFDQNKKNFLAIVDRLRGTRGLPSDPDGFAYRAARTIMNLNVLRQMGMVLTSSFPDLGRPVMRYGLTRTFRDGFAPLVTNLKTMKLNAREAHLAGVGTDISAHQRSMAYRDITDELHHGSAVEKGIEYATNRMGIVALFDYWTQAGELVTSSIANAKLMDSLARINTASGTMTDKAATTFLAENGIDGVLAERIWKQVADGGGGKVDGVWWPNTESWTDPIALRAYRAALAREVTNTIIRPGVERPLLSDVNMLGRMLYQFKSFGMASMPKITMAGLQQRDASILAGSMASLGLGAMSYYLWAVATGGKAYEDMMKADLDKWADEAINRSGLLGTVSEVQRIAQTIPLLEPIASFSGSRQTRRPGDDLVEALGGPSLGFLQSASNVVTGLDQPTQSTLRDFRRLLPYQNTVILRSTVDAAEAAVGSHLPERRR
jgi:hypothetical protein